MTDNSNKAIAPDFDEQMTVGELKEALDEYPDYAGVNIQTGGAVGIITDVSINADGVLLIE